mmetsp:Transcript_16698/g.19244  ORF Transcript_16698/g.19244 Transcript_16698/m.19244 type:complete len:595 (-) Transcript_16698:731-2515(-)|eukprot:CAMPEP_0194137388 /NCGR_PEP_ID=MMETSP0152-20130528/7289_1 /TAXON_ID=1049557 /ORGANISM="Thalassiothrix antarctica, Strain L6-D1" /LENGTH=594 /DNA_ID=CAMNT_0038834397 /DNA_START=98 /DNA_END=1882 /DNA_ORIENTATION=-
MSAMFGQSSMVLAGVALGILLLATLLMNSIPLLKGSSKKKKKNKSKAKRKKAKKKAEEVAREEAVREQVSREQAVREQVAREQAARELATQAESQEKAALESSVESEITVKKKKRKKKKKKAEIMKPTPEPPTEEEEDLDDDDDVARLLNKKQLAKTQQGKNTEKKKKKKPGEEKDETWVMVNKGEKSSAVDAIPAEPDNTMRTEVVNIGYEDKAVLIGPKGATINGIQSRTETTLDIDLPVVKIRGTSSAIALATAEVKNLLSAHKEEERRKTAFSKVLSGKDINGSEGVKAIIGKGGQNIKSIQTETECKLDANVEKGQVVITGPTEEGVVKASTLCKHAVFGESQYVIDLKSVAMVRLVFGKDYKKIRQIQDESGAKLDISKGSSKTLKLSGKREDVAKARAIVEEWLEYCKGEVIEIEANQVGAVYGKGGETISKIQNRTGAFVEVDDNGKKGNDLVSCHILGEPEAVKEAKNLVLKVVEGEIELKDGEVMEEIELEVGAPAVIGRGGSRIRELEKEFSVKLVIKSGAGLCRVVGRPSAVEKARNQICNIIAPLLEEKRINEEAERLAEEAATNTDSGAWGGTVDDGDGW